MTKQKGFGLVKGLLLLVIVGIIGGAGYFVYQSQSKTNQSLDNANKNLQQLAEKNKTDSTDNDDIKNAKTNDWFEFTFSKNEDVSFMVPDGWNLTHQTDSDIVYAAATADLVFKPGQKATIETTTGGRDGALPFYAQVIGETDLYAMEGDRQQDLELKDGLTAEVYFYEQSGAPEGIGLPDGAKQYTYVITLPNNRRFIAGHAVLPGESAQTELIEKLLATVHTH